MSSEFDSEKKFSITNAIEKCKGIRVHLSTGVRWIKNGVKTPKGPVKLEASTLGGRWYTSIEAVKRFDLAVIEAKAGSKPNLDASQSKVRSDSRRQRDLNRANLQLDAMGV